MVFFGFRPADTSTDRAHNLLAPSQIFNNVESSSSWPLSNRWSEGTIANLPPSTYNPHKSSAATHSQYSESTWETVPSTPCAEDYDLRPIPDEHSACIQSCNDPRDGIWTQEHAYEQGTGHSAVTVMPCDSGMRFGATRVISQNLQRVLANAEAATPFGTELRSNREAFGAHGTAPMVLPLLSPRSTIGGPVPQHGRFSPRCPSAVSIMINGKISAAFPDNRPPAFPDNRPPAFEHSTLDSFSDHEISSNIAPRTVMENPLLLPAMDLMFLDASASPPPSSSTTTKDSAATSTSSVARCTHKGCRKQFTGGTRRDTLRRHERLHHRDNPVLVCPVCDLVIQSGRPDNLKRHIAYKHPGYTSVASLNAREKRNAGSKRAVPRISAKARAARRHG